MTYASAYLVRRAVLVLALLLVVLNRMILTPLASVTRHAVAIGEGNGPDGAARLSGATMRSACLAREFDRMVARVAESRRQLVDQSFQAGFAELAKGVLHNLGNAMTPLGVRLAKLGERLREAPADDAGAGGARSSAATADAGRAAPTWRNSCAWAAEELAHTVRRRARTSRSSAARRARADGH